MKRLPMPRFPQRRAHAPGRVAQKTDWRHSGQPAALPEDQARVQMADDGLLDLPDLVADRVVVPEERKGRGIVRKKEDALLRFQTGERRADILEVPRAELFPRSPLFRQGVPEIDRQRDERRRNADQNITPELEAPERFETELAAGALEARHAHSAAAADKAELAEFMVADGRAETRAETAAQFAETFPRALAGGGVADADETRVAGVIAIGHDVVGRAGLL